MTIHCPSIHGSFLTLTLPKLILKILISVTDAGSNLERVLQSNFPSVEVVKLERSVFGESEGLLALRGLVCPSEQPTLEELIAKKHLCLASSAALLTHLTEACNVTFLPNTLDVQFCAGEGLLLLDPLTVRSLELLEPNISSSAAHSSSMTGARIKSLFDVLNHTRTPQGARLLKCNLIQAPSDINTIRFRQSCVKEILNDETLYFGLSTALQAFSDIDPVLSLFSRSSLPPSRKSSTTASNAIRRFDSFMPTASHTTQPTSNSTSDKNILHLAYSKISTLLRFKRSLNGLPTLRQLISDSKHPFFVALSETLSDPNLEVISDVIDESMADTSQALGTGAFKIQARKSIQQRDVIYALKDGIYGLLDAARQVYKERLEDTEELAAGYKQEFPALGLQLVHNASRGYHLRITESKNHKKSTTNSTRANIAADEALEDYFEDENSDSEFGTSAGSHSSHTLPFISTLPDIFILRAKNRNRLEFTTEGLVAMNSRLTEARTEIVLITSQLLDEVQDTIRERVSCLYKFGESIALLDMLFAFATYVTLSPVPCCIPEFSQPSHDSHIQIVKGYHPLILALHGTPLSSPSSSAATSELSSMKQAHPNTIRSSKAGSYVHIITGRNNSGKTTFLTQTGVLVLLAHMGSYIPATFASITLTDRILTRIGNEDETIATADAGANSSSFYKEMRIAGYILESATSNSVVLLDELGKSTDTDDGLPICFAITERLISRNVQTFFATHFLELASSIQAMYASVFVHRMDCVAKMDAKTGKETRECNFTLVDGCEMDSGYGTQLASEAGWPQCAITLAEKVRLIEGGGIDFGAQPLDPSSSLLVRTARAESRGGQTDIARLKRMVYEQLKIAKQSDMTSLDLSLFLHRLATRYREKMNELNAR